MVTKITSQKSHHKNHIAKKITKNNKLTLRVADIYAHSRVENNDGTTCGINNIRYWWTLKTSAPDYLCKQNELNNRKKLVACFTVGMVEDVDCVHRFDSFARDKRIGCL